MDITMGLCIPSRIFPTSLGYIFKKTEGKQPTLVSLPRPKYVPTNAYILGTDEPLI